MGCFSGRLMTSASDQKLFCEICSAFSYSFDDFVGEKVVSPSYFLCHLGSSSWSQYFKSSSEVYRFFLSYFLLSFTICNLIVLNILFVYIEIYVEEL